MKKIYVLLLLIAMMLAQIFSIHVFADKETEIVLIEEYYEEMGGVQAYIYRNYQIVGQDETIPYTINIPDPIYQKIKNSDDPLLEAKKELTVAYRYLKLEKRLSELNGIYLNGYPTATIRVGYDLEEKFNEQLDIANLHAESEVQRIEKLSKTEQENLYDVNSDSLDYIDYGKEEEFFKKTKPNYGENKKLLEEDLKAIDVELKDEVNNKLPLGYYAVIGLILFIVVFLVVYVFKKRG